LAGLNVITSQKHSQRVSYVKAGFDAMVNYGTSDLVFENNTDGEIYILCKYADSDITISIYGSDLKNVSYDRSYEIVNHVTAEPTQIIYDTDGKYADKVVFNDEFFELKKSRDGYTIKSYLIKYIDGRQVDKILLRTDKYVAQQGVLVYGSKVRQETFDVLNFVEDDI
jgi:vancomycin resistance protein YoaR